MKDLSLSCDLQTKKLVGTKINPTSNIIVTKVYPNPNNGLFKIDCERNTEVVIYNLLGEIVYNKVHSVQSEIDVRDLPKGIYVLKAIGNMTTSFKLVVE